MKKAKMHVKIKNVLKNFAFCVVILIFAFCIFNFVGCAEVWEGAKGITGVSTKALEDNRKAAITKAFNYDYFTCYTKSLDILKAMKAYIYTQSIKKHMIAIYVSEWDTTPVGLFFKEIDKNNTQIEVSSLSTYAKEFISGELFPILDKKMTLEQLEAGSNAKQEKEARESQKAREAGRSH